MGTKTVTTLQPNDIFFQSASVVDGSGTTKAYLADVLVRNGLIHSISPPGSFSSRDTNKNIRTIDCESGRWTLCPGFIDMHAHSDLSLLHTPDHLAKITQGVTTEVIGQDGIAYAPVDDKAMVRISKQIAGWNGYPKEAGFFDRWRSVREYLNILDDSRIATNAAFLVPQGNLRILSVGYAGREAAPEEIEKMKVILVQALEEGAVGMSSGLSYVPSNYTTFSELKSLCEVLVKYNAYYCPHHRSYGTGAIEAYAEMIRLARETGVRLHLTHATLNWDVNAGRAGELLRMIDEAMKEGCKITLDTYPYLPGSTTLASQLPYWAGSAPDPMAVLDDKDQCEQIKEDVSPDWHLIEIGGTMDSSLGEQVVGKRISNIASERNEDPWDTFFWLLKADKMQSTILSHVGNEGNVRKIMRFEGHTGGSDGILTSTKPHPRGWGTFARYIGHYHRDLSRGKSRNIYAAKSNRENGQAGDFEDVEPEKIFEGGLEEVVSHLTYRAAQVIRAEDRGLVREGYRADLVLFDEEEIRDVATFADPERAAKGIRTVLVNGSLAVDEGKPTRARAGRTIRMQKSGNAGEWQVR